MLSGPSEIFSRSTRLSVISTLGNRLVFWLLPLLAAGCGLFAWSLSGALGWNDRQRFVLALAGAAAFLLLWVLESAVVARLKKLCFREAGRKTIVTQVPFIILPLSAPYFTHRVFSSFFAGGPSGPRIAAVTLMLLFLVAAGGICLKAVTLWGRGGELLAAIERRSVPILWAGVAVYFIAFTAMAFLAYSQYRYHSDLAQYNQTLWATLRGHFFYSSIEETSGSFLSTHVSPFLLMILPVYALKQSPLTILFLRSLALALAAVPLFYCVRRITGSAVAALILAAGFLLHPEIVAQHFTSGYEVVFVAALFFAAFYFLMERRFGLFVFFLIMVLMVREDFAPAAFVFAVYALIKRMPLRWVLTPLVLGIVWQTVVTLIFNATIEHWVFNLYYGHFGDSPTEMVKTVVAHPVYALEETWSLQKSYLYNLLMPMGFVLPWTSLVSIFAIPNLAGFLARSNDVAAAAGGISHYSVLVVSALWLGLAGFIGRSRKWAAASKQTVTAVAFSIVILVMVLSSAHVWAYRLPTGKPADAAALDSAIALIPADAAVSSNDGRVFPRLSSRLGLYEPLVWDVIEEPDRLPHGIEQLKLGEYVILKPFGHPFYNDEESFRFVTEPGSPYELIFEEQGIRVYRKVDR